MATYTDDFNRANSTSIGNWLENTSGWAINNNQLQPDDVTSYVVYLSPLDTSDQYAEVVISTIATTSMGVFARSNQFGNSFYLWRNNGTSWDLFVNDSGSFIAIGNSFAGSASNGDVARIQVQGSTITGFVNGVQRATATDTTITSGLYAGIRNGADSSPRYDSFLASDISSGGSGNGDVVGIAWTGIV
jgi:hypothetical protein